MTSDQLGKGASLQRGTLEILPAKPLPASSRRSLQEGWENDARSRYEGNIMKKSGFPLVGLSLVLFACQASEPAPAAKPATPATTEAPSPAAAAATPTPPALRLGDTVVPTGYDAALTVVPNDDRFEGHISIDVDVRQASNVIWLNARNLAVRTATVNGTPAKVLPGGTDFVGIQPNTPLAAGKATLVLDYSGAIDGKTSSGLFKNKEGDAWYALTQFESTYARRVFPCFDEPNFKVPWKLKLKVKRDQVALSNTPPVSENTVGEYKTVQFAETKPLPSYLVAFAVGPFDIVDAGTAGKNKTPVRIITPHGRAAEAHFAKEVTPQILNELESYFGIPYPYEKLDCIDAPMLRGAMENAGLVTFNQRLILSPPDKESTSFRRAYTSVAAHELAHQWFGDLVTTAWWDDIWLNEAFATWMENTLLSKWKPEWHIELERAERTQHAMTADALQTARRIRQPIATYDDIGAAFDAITYQKGAAVIGMFEHWVSPDVFRKGVQHYLSQHAYGNATADQFLHDVFEGAPASVQGAGAAFGTFLNQSGVPLLSVNLHCDAGKPPSLTVSQSRYVPLGSEASADQKWQIPVCARYPGKRGTVVTCSLLSEGQGEVALSDASTCPAWVDANADALGYYRVLYEGNGLKKLLSAPAGATGLNGAEKTALLGDLEALTRSGKVPYADALSTASRIARDPAEKAGVVKATLELTSELRDTPMFGEDLTPKYAKFIRDTYGARAAALGFTPRAKEDDDTRLLRPRLLALVADQGDDHAIQTEARKRADKWLTDGQGIDPELVETVLGIAAQQGDRAFEIRLAEAAHKAKSRFERTQILHALGQLRNPDAVRAMLDLTLADDLDPRESFSLITGALTTPATRDIAYTFVKQRYDALSAKGANDASPYLGRILGPADLAKTGVRFCDDEHRADVEGFFRDRAARFSGGAHVLAEVVETVKLCTAFRATQSPSVAAFLQKR